MIALITGANAGIGLATAQLLAQKGYELIIWCRSLSKSESTKAAVLQKAPNAIVHCYAADLGDLRAVQQTAQQIAEKFPRLDVLINNAGYLPTAVEYTPEGIEKTFYASHLGHFVLTKVMLPLLTLGNDPRIINLSSEAHFIGDPDRPFNPAGTSTFKAYGDAKLANLLFTIGLRSRLANTPIKAYAVHPGVVNTNFADNMRGAFWRVMVWLAKPFLITPEKGAATSVYLAATPTKDIPEGLYFAKSRPKRTANKTVTPAAAETLWKRSEELLTKLGLGS